MGHNVIDTASGSNAADIIRNENIHLLLTDVLMPDCDGIELLKSLKPVFPNLKIVAMSGGGKLNADYYLDAARKFGADLTCSKADGVDGLIRAVSQLLDAK
jgi:DNA-binding NarL/FixJ family response regulator